MLTVLGNSGYIGRNLLRRVAPQIPDVIVNAIGRKDLRFCEEQPIEAYISNAIRPATEAVEAKWANKRYIHIGSDHAYASKSGAHTVYAKSKLLGDELVLLEYPEAVVLVTGHVYAPDCPWVKWLDGELRAGRQVKAYRNRLCCPTWMGDLVTCIESLIPTMTSGRVFCTGPDRVDRVQLFRTYAEVFGYDPDLIVPDVETDPVLIGDMCVGSDYPCRGIREGFEAMKREIEDVA